MGTHLTTSVIIPTYNRADLLVRAIRSVVPQLVEGDEILVMDDGSTDHTAEAVRAQEGNIRYFQLENGGPSRARNIGVQRAVGDLLAFLDDDDEWWPHKLRLQRTVMRARSEVMLCFTNFTGQFRNGRRLPGALLAWGQRERHWDRIFERSEPFSAIGALPSGIADFMVHSGTIYLRQMFDDYVLPSTQVIRRTDATAAVRFPEDLRFCESWAYSSAISALGPVTFLDVDTVTQHDHDGPRLTEVDVLQQTASRLTVLERQWGRDLEFLRLHRHELEAREDEELILRVREHIANAAPHAARADLRRLHANAPVLLRLLSSMPRFILRLANSLRSIRVAR